MDASKVSRAGRRLRAFWEWLNKHPNRTALEPFGESTEAAPASHPDTPSASLDKASVAQYWSDPHLIEDHFSADVYWLANRRVQQRYRRKATGGESTDCWYGHFARKYFGPRLPVPRMLSVGCGEGGLELDLAKIDVFRAMDAWDLASGSIERANLHAAKAGETRIRFAVRDIENTSLPRNTYDGVWFNMSLHHVNELEKVVAEVATALKPDGFLFLNEYVGPSRFAFSAREKEAMSALFRLLPDCYRRCRARSNYGAVLEAAGFPDPAEVARVDPSESIRSADILPVVRSLFDIIELNLCGGTLLQFMFGNIMGNFREEDPLSTKTLDWLFAAEDLLIELGEISSHFVVLAARPRSGVTTLLA